MFNIKITLIGELEKLINNEYKTVNQEIILAQDKIQTVKISNDLYLSFPHLYCELFLDNITIKIKYLKFEVDDNESVKREWKFTIYKQSVSENKTKIGINTNTYIIKGLSIPVQHLNRRITTTYNKSSSELIQDIFSNKDTMYNISVDTKLNTTSINWNRVNMTDLQFFNYLKDNTQLINNYQFIPLFYLKNILINTEVKQVLSLQNLYSITKKYVKYEVNFDDIVFTYDAYNIITEDTNRIDYLHMTKPYFSTINGFNRKNHNNFTDSILTEYINNPNLLTNIDTNYMLKILYKNSSQVMFPQITNGYYLNMVDIGNVFFIKSYINKDNKQDISYFNIIGYELEFKNNNAHNIITSKLICQPLKK